MSAAVEELILKLDSLKPPAATIFILASEISVPVSQSPSAGMEITRSLVVYQPPSGLPRAMGMGVPR